MTTATTKISALPSLSTFVDNAIIPTSVTGTTYKVTGTAIASYILGKIPPTTEFVSGDWHVRINNIGALELVNYARDQNFGGVTPWFDDQANTWGVKVNANYDWTFQNDGKFVIPSGGDIVDSNGQSVLINTGDVTFTGSMLTTPSNTDQNWPNGVIVLAPGTTGNAQYTYNGQFLNIYPTNANDAPHIHIAAGGTAGQITGDLVLGDDSQYVDINHLGSVFIRTKDPILGGNWLWEFGKGGTLELPASGNVKQSNSKTKTASVYSVTTGTVIWTASENIIGSAKLLIQTECFEVNDTSGSHFQTCEAIIASRVMANGQTGYGDPIMTVYGVVHTSNLPMVTFTVQRNLTTHLIEVVATMTATADGLATVSVYSVEMALLQIGP